MTVLDTLAGGITSPFPTHRGLTARLRYITRSEHARSCPCALRRAAHSTGRPS
ncbi:hypothetical protein [Streptomyces sp. NPDC049915]|uniref:hypothetical protein n=1 Tax=Streptomyces sp. NPDC049915 TaxID=3155510 RepID=UPI00343251F3